MLLVMEMSGSESGLVLSVCMHVYVCVCVCVCMCICTSECVYVDGHAHMLDCVSCSGKQCN